MSDTEIAVDRLHSWKEIAEYLHCDVRTAIRWEVQRGLPVHRLPGGRRQGVFAYRQELEAWLRNDPVSHNASLIALTNGVIEAQPPVPIVSDVATPRAEEFPHAGGRSQWLTRSFASIAALGIFSLLFTAIGLRRIPTQLTVENPTRITQSQTRILSPLLRAGAQITYPRYENGRYSVASVPINGGGKHGCYDGNHQSRTV